MRAAVECDPARVETVKNHSCTRRHPSTQEYSSTTVSALPSCAILRVMRVRSLTFCVMVMGALTHPVEGEALPGHSNPDQPHSIILTAASQDGEVFVTWSPIASAQHTIRWKPASASTWTMISAGSSSARAIVGLANGVSYDFQIEARQGGSLVAVSAVIAATPRPRPNCVVLDYYPWVPARQLLLHEVGTRRLPPTGRDQSAVASLPSATRDHLERGFA